MGRSDLGSKSKGRCGGQRASISQRLFGYGGGHCPPRKRRESEKAVAAGREPAYRNGFSGMGVGTAHRGREGKAKKPLRRAESQHIATAFRVWGGHCPPRKRRESEKAVATGREPAYRNGFSGMGVGTAHRGREGKAKKPLRRAESLHIATAFRVWGWALPTRRAFCRDRPRVRSRRAAAPRLCRSG